MPPGKAGGHLTSLECSGSLSLPKLWNSLIHLANLASRKVPFGTMHRLLPRFMHPDRNVAPFVDGTSVVTSNLANDGHRKTGPIRIRTPGFDRRFVRRLTGKFRRREIADRPVWTLFVVVQPPHFELRTGIGEREDNIHIEALISQPSVKALDEAIL